MNRIWDQIFFFSSVSAYLLPFWLKIMPEWGFLICWIFYYFFRNFLPCPSMNGIRDKKFFLALSANLTPFWVRIMPERDFFIFWIFLLFFLEISCPGRVWTKFGAKFFFFFLGLFQPVLDRNNARMNFFNFLNFFAIFFLEFSSSGRVWTEFGTKIFFCLFQPISSRIG